MLSATLVYHETGVLSIPFQSSQKVHPVFILLSHPYAIIKPSDSENQSIIFFTPNIDCRYSEGESDGTVSCRSCPIGARKRLQRIRVKKARRRDALEPQFANLTYRRHFYNGSSSSLDGCFERSARSFFCRKKEEHFVPLHSTSFTSTMTAFSPFTENATSNAPYRIR